MAIDSLKHGEHASAAHESSKTLSDPKGEGREVAFSSTTGITADQCL